MKILVLTTTFPRWVNDKIPVFIYDLSKRLRENGIEIVILAPHDEEAKKIEMMDGMKVYRFPYFYPTKYQRLAYEGGIPSNLKRSYLAKLQAPLMLLSELYHSFKIVKKEDIDLVHSHCLIPNGLVGALCKKFLGVPHMTTIHSSEVTMIRKIPTGKRIAEFVLKRSDRIVSVSSHRIKELLGIISSEIGESLKNRIQIIPMGADLSEFSNKIDKHKLEAKYGVTQNSIVLFVGRLVEVKGCEYLIKGFKSLLDKTREVQLIILGGGPLESDLKKTVQDLKIGEYVKFEGFVEHCKVSDYLSLSDIVVFPSIVDSSGFKEGFSVALLEALASGKPIVATRTEGFLEAIEDGWNGFLVEPENPEEIANKILELLKNQELRTKFSENALETSKKYEWSLIAGKYVEIFREISVS